MEKFCKKCNLSKDIDDFAKNKSKKDGLNTYCKQCQKPYKDSHYRNNKERYINKNRNYREKVKQFVSEYKKDKKCERCPENFPQCLHFHHLDPKQKEFNIALAVRNKVTIEKIKEEIDKCIILCANCHIKEHFIKKY